jgi:hypothetical protein
MVPKAQYVLKDGDGLGEVFAFVRASLYTQLVSVIFSRIIYQILTLVKASTSQKVHIENAPSRPPTPMSTISKLSTWSCEATRQPILHVVHRQLVISVKRLQLRR